MRYETRQENIFWLFGTMELVDSTVDWIIEIFHGTENCQNLYEI